MNRYSPRLTGFGKQFMEQALSKNILKAIMTPAFKKKIREEFGCTDTEIDEILVLARELVRDA